MALALVPTAAHAVSSAELYTSASYRYGRIEARVQFAGGDGVVSSFFLWKDGSERADVYWNELDFEKLGADCHLETNVFYGMPAKVNPRKATLAADLCGGFHTYAYEWTPDAIAWFVDGVEIRRETGEAAAAFSENATEGMQIRFNIWPGDSTFGGNFSPSILPVHQYIDWVEYFSYSDDGTFESEWREEFSGASLPSGWLTGNWGSPKNLSTHTGANVNFMDGYAVLSLTADDALGPAGATPGSPGSSGSDSESSNDGGCSVAGSRSRPMSGFLALFGVGAGVLLRRRTSSALASSAQHAHKP